MSQLSNNTVDFISSSIAESTLESTDRIEASEDLRDTDFAASSEIENTGLDLVSQSVDTGLPQSISESQVSESGHCAEQSSVIHKEDSVQTSTVSPESAQIDYLENGTDLNSNKNVELDNKSSEDRKADTSFHADNDADSVKENDVRDAYLKPQSTDDEWMDILGNGLLKKKVLTVGLDKSRPPAGHLVTVKIKGWVQDNKHCFQDNMQTFVLGDGDVIAALDMAVSLMNCGEVAEMITAPRFAYGKLGREPDIPSEATLIYHLELVNVQAAPDIDQQTVEQRLIFGEKKRERGNELFKREDYTGAINSYSKAVKWVEGSKIGMTGDTSILQQLLDCKLKCYNNMGASQLKIGAFDAVIRSCDEVLQCQPDNIKALYRLGKAYSAKGQTKKAITILKKALQLDPESKMLHRELAWLTKQEKKEVESEKTLYKRMMGNISDSSPADKKRKKHGNGIWMWTFVAGGAIVAALSIGMAVYRFGH